MKIVSLLCFGIALAIGLSGCESTRSARDGQRKTPARFDPLTNLTPVVRSIEIKPEWRHAQTNFYTLGPGDKLEIELLDEPGTLETVLAGPDGKIYYYLLPGLKVWGLTLAEAKARITSEMAKYLQREPKLSLTLRGVASKQIWLLGRINAPGVYTLSAPTTLLEAIAMAGGPAGLTPIGSTAGGGAQFSGAGGGDADFADLRRSFVIRKSQVIPIDLHRLLREGDMAQNIYLQPDDFVFLPSRVSHDVYVLGAVRAPTAVKYDDSISLISAVASAAGTIKNAYLSHVAIVRGSLTEPKIAVVDFNDVIHGKAHDIRLEPGDIVYVPFSPYETLIRYADIILDTFVRTVGINEGARAVTRQVAPVGVNVPIGTLR